VDPIGVCIDAMHTITAVLTSAPLLSTPALPVPLKPFLEALLEIYPDASVRESMKITVDIAADTTVRAVSHQLAAMLLSFLIAGSADLESVGTIYVTAKPHDKSVSMDVLLSTEDEIPNALPTEPANSYGVYTVIRTRSLLFFFFFMKNRFRHLPSSYLGWHLFESVSTSIFGTTPVLRCSDTSLLFHVSLPSADSALPLTPLKLSLPRQDSASAIDSPLRSPSLPYVFTPRQLGSARNQSTQMTFFLVCVNFFHLIYIADVCRAG
jgi:hypothetical protein